MEIKLENMFATFVTVGAIVVSYVVMDFMEKNSKINREFNRTYNQALFQYVDTNNDSLVSLTEQDEFDRKLFSNKGVTFINGNEPKYQGNGRTVPKEIITKWIIGYQPRE